MTSNTVCWMSDTMTHMCVHHLFILGVHHSFIRVCDMCVCKCVICVFVCVCGMCVMYMRVRVWCVHVCVDPCVCRPTCFRKHGGTGAYVLKGRRGREGISTYMSVAYMSVDICCTQLSWRERERHRVYDRKIQWENMSMSEGEWK